LNTDILHLDASEVTSANCINRRGIQFVWSSHSWKHHRIRPFIYTTIVQEYTESQRLHQDTIARITYGMAQQNAETLISQVIWMHKWY